MEVDFEGLKKELRSVDLEGISVVPYRERIFWVDSMSFPDGKPAQWFESTGYSGADIYLWGGLREDFKRPFILHEIVEADLVLYQKVNKKTAHEEAKKFDRKYAESILSEEEFSDYEKARKGLENAFRD